MKRPLRWSRRGTLAVLDLPDEDPETIIHHFQIPPQTIANALWATGHRDLARTYRQIADPSTQRSCALVVDEVERFAAESPEETCRVLAMRPASIARSLQRAGRPELARPFDRLARQTRRAG